MAEIITIDQGFKNHALWTKSGLLLIFVDKVLLEHSHAYFVYGLSVAVFL